jgi:cytochrome P450
LSEIRQTREEFGENWLSNPKVVFRCSLFWLALTCSKQATGAFTFLEQCYHESIRIAQQSLTLRLVLRPIQIGKYTVAPGYYIATLLSCLNQQESLLLSASKFEPELHYERGGKLKEDSLAAAGSDYCISTFGHGPHACPGKMFAIASAKSIIGSLLDQFDVSPPEGRVSIIETQMGAVGRPVTPAILKFRKK